MTPIVFIDFAGPDDEALARFYDAAFGWKADQEGKFSAPVMAPVECAFRKDPAEKRVYLGVPDVAESLAQIETLNTRIRSETKGGNSIAALHDQRPAGD